MEASQFSHTRNVWGGYWVKRLMILPCWEEMDDP
jgi:hypothetical protein